MVMGKEGSVCLCGMGGVLVKLTPNGEKRRTAQKWSGRMFLGSDLGSFRSFLGLRGLDLVPVSGSEMIWEPDLVNSGVQQQTCIQTLLSNA